MQTVIPISKRGRAHRVRDVAQMLNVSTRTVEREIARGRLRADTLSARAKRIFDDAINEYVERMRGES
jgi:excisionase family DNA binding protein